MSDLVTKTADALPVTSRNFYENATFKLFLSMVWAAIGLFFLGLCSAYGGQSRAANYLKGTGFSNSASGAAVYNTDDKVNTAEQDGFGFAAFFFFCAFALMIGAAFHISPVTNGSPKESLTLRRPVDLER